MKIFHRRNLPHFYPAEAIYFITFRLKDSIQMTVLKTFQQEREQTLKGMAAQEYGETQKKEMRHLAEGDYFLKNDTWLDKSSNEPYWLKEEACAQIVADAIHYQAGKNYKLWAFCIMPNHVHLLISLLPQSESLSKIMMKMKGFTAKQCNKVLSRSGEFWQDESFDRVVRHGKFDSTLFYILNNPVKAGFVGDWKDWKWTYCNPELL